MHIDQEIMSKEKDFKHSPPNVVAKLMGLEALPRGEPNSAVERSHRKDYPQHMYGHSGLPFKHWQLKNRFMDKEMLHDHEVHRPSTEHIAYEDISEIWLQKSQRTRHVTGKKTPERGIRWSEEDVDGKKMALIRQKFMEAKRLSTDKRLRQSKQFEDALEVLSSNSDLLIKLLDSQNLYELHCAPPAETKRTTLVKPLNMQVDNDNEKSAGKRNKSDAQVKKPANVDQAAVWENKNAVYSSASIKVDEFPVQSSRIVVLKPSSGGTHELKAVVSSTTSSPQNLQSGNFYEGPEDDVLESRKVAQEITLQMHETLYSSVFSNGHRSYESSFNKSDHEYNTAGNFSDLEAMSTLSRHSWDYINGCGGSAYSAPSLGGAYCSPESSVCREAKKRLSERWTMMASNNKGPQEQRHVKRSSTLGEMLSLSHIKKSVTSEVEVEGFNVEGQEPTKFVSCSHSFNEEISIDGSPKNLPWSNYVPASSTVYETGLKVEVCDHDAGKAHGSKLLTKSKSMRSSFKGKVISFLFSRSKKPNKEKSSLSQSKHESQSTATETSVSSVNSTGVLRDDGSQSFNSFEQCSLAALCESFGKTSSDSVSNGQQQGIITPEPGLAVPKPMVPEISSENQDQPSPISVLEPPFEDDNAVQSLDCVKGGHQGSRMPLKSNLIDKSPPIESIARTLSWDDSCADLASPYPLKPLMVSSLDTKVEEQEWLPFVEKLISAAGLDDQVHYDSFYTRWHSHESPLDPSLRDKYANLNGKEPQPLHEAKRRKMRSIQKLVFDCVNAALLEINGYYGSEKYFKSRMYSGSHSRFPVQEGSSPYLMDHIVAQMNELIASGRCVWGDCGDNNSLVVENVVRKEVVGIGWVELMGLEIDILGREIEGELIEELVENVVADFTGRA